MHRFLKLSFLFMSLFGFSQNTTSNYSIYVSDAGNYNNPPWQIMKYDANGENGIVFTKDSLAWPQDMLFLKDKSEVLIANLNSGKINRHDSKTGAYLGVFAEGIGGPTRTKIGPDGCLYVLQWAGNGNVLRYNLNGTLEGEFTEKGVPQSIGMDWDEAGNLYVSSFQKAFVKKFNKSGKDLGVFVKDSLTGPTNIWFNKKKELMVLDWKGGFIALYDSNGNFIKKITTGLNKIEGIVQLQNGNLLIGNGGTGSVKEITLEGKIVKEIIVSNAAGLKTPNAVVISY